MPSALLRQFLKWSNQSELIDRMKPMKQITSFAKRHPTAAFFVLTFILSWGFGTLTDIIYEATHSIILTLPIALLSAGPLLAALVVSALLGGKTAVLALLRQFTVWRVELRWYLIALLLPLMIHLTAVYLNVLMGAPAPTAASFGTGSALLGAFALRLVNPWDGPMLEELGWRGFALPRLQQRYSPLTANLILGVLVVIWHFQYIPSGNYAWIYIPGTLAATLLFGWVYNATGGSVLLTLLMHVTDGLIWANFTGADGTRYRGLLVLVYVVTAVIVVFLTGKNLGQAEHSQPVVLAMEGVR
jgi:membrane protease YdiL (CAAX protease family)